MPPLEGLESRIDRIERYPIADIDGDGAAEELLIMRNITATDVTGVRDACGARPSSFCQVTYPGAADRYCADVPAMSPLALEVVRTGHLLLLSSGKTIGEIQHHNASGELLGIGQRVRWGGMGIYWYGTITGFDTAIDESADGGKPSFYVMAGMRDDNGETYKIDSRVLRPVGEVTEFLRGCQAYIGL